MIQHPVPEEHLASIGDIIVSFALLEFGFQTLIGSLLNDKQRIGQIVTAELSFKNMRALAESLFIERNGRDLPEYERLRELSQSASKAEATRNQIVHSIWAAGTTSETITRSKTTAKEKHGIKHQFEEMSASELRSISTYIKGIAGDIQVFVMLLIKDGKAANSPLR